MYILRSLRYPTALAFGLLLTASIFWSLWSFTNVPFEIPAVRPAPIKLDSVRPEIPEERKNILDKIEVPPVIIPPLIEGISGTETTIEPSVIRSTVTPPILDRPGLSFSRDRDVLPLVRIEPEYPQRALANNIEGWVKVQFTITATGAVKDVMVVENSPSNIFDDATVKAVSRWRYNPRVEGAVAVERVGVQTILRFNLEE